MHSQRAPVYEVHSPHKKNRNSSAEEDSFPKKKMSANDLYDKVEKLPLEQPIKKNTPVIIISGLVLKKCGWFFYRARQLILNSKPSLLYFDPETNIKKVNENI